MNRSGDGRVPDRECGEGLYCWEELYCGVGWYCGEGLYCGDGRDCRDVGEGLSLLRCFSSRLRRILPHLATSFLILTNARTNTPTCLNVFFLWTGGPEERGFSSKESQT